MIRIVFLGTGPGFPSKRRNFSSIYLEYNGFRMLFDCGEGTLRQMCIKGLKYMKLDAIFITHWHPDHYLGLPSIVQTLALDENRAPLQIYGPEKTAEFVKKIFEVGYCSTCPMAVRELSPGDVVKFKGFSVKAFETKHVIPSIGFIFQEDEKVNVDLEKAKEFGLSEGPILGKLKQGEIVKWKGKIIRPEEIVIKAPGKKIVYTGDTKYFEELIEYCKNADLLICESTFASDAKENVEEYMHMLSKEAGILAKKAGVKKLILTHISRRYEEDNALRKLLVEAKTEFDNVEVAEDFMEIRVE